MENRLETYEELTVEVILFETEDVILDSNNGDFYMPEIPNNH